MTAADEIKAGKYEVLALHWDEIHSGPGEALEFTRHNRGDVVDLDADDARRLVLAGAAGEPGALQRQQLETAKAQLAAAQAAYDAFEAGVKSDLGPVADELGENPGGAAAGDGDGPPARAATKDEWVAYAVSQGFTQEDAEAATKDDLVAQFKG